MWLLYDSMIQHPRCVYISVCTCLRERAWDNSYVRIICVKENYVCHSADYLSLSQLRFDMINQCVCSCRWTHCRCRCSLSCQRWWGRSGPTELWKVPSWSPANLAALLLEQISSMFNVFSMLACVITSATTPRPNTHCSPNIFTVLPQIKLINLNNC